MLSIRTEQMSDFSRAVQAGFEDEFQTSLRRAYPRHIRVFGEGAMRAFVHLVLERALGHGLDDRHSCSQYLSLALVFGAFFDADPQLPWAAQTLANEELSNERKIDRLRLSAARYSTSVTGPENSYLHAALEQMRAQAEHPRLAATGQDDERLFFDLMRDLYPEKYAALTPEIRRTFLEEAMRKVSEYQLTDRLAIRVFVILLFLLGSGCDRDPLHPWIKDVLEDASLDPAAKGHRLLETSRAYLQQVADVIGPGA